jgi:hypothetical protein
MNLKAQVTPSGVAEQIKNKYYFTVDSIGSSTPTWHDANPDGKPTANGDYLEATVTFSGLPANNSDFGAKKTAIYCDGNKLDEEIFEVFFPKEGYNHPGADADWPNWFYYWNQTAAGHPNCVFQWPLPEVGGNVTTPMGVYDPSTDTPYIGLGAGADTIDWFARTILHEIRHQDDYHHTHGPSAAQDWDGDWIADTLETDQNWDQGKGGGGLANLAVEVWTDLNGNGEVDVGEDEGLPVYIHKAGTTDTWAIAFKDNTRVDSENLSGTTSPFSMYTFKNLSATYAANGIIEYQDVEWWASFAEQQWVEGTADAEDWANPGANY